MEYRSIFNHPKHGELRNLAESAKYLGISRPKFRRIAPSPDYVQYNVYPFWSKRVLDMLPTDEGFDPREVRTKGIACGEYLAGGMTDEEMENLRHCLSDAERSLDPVAMTTKVLEQHGITITFRSPFEARLFRHGISSGIHKYNSDKSYDKD